VEILYERCLIGQYHIEISVFHIQVHNM
jgi:hypothetical protein